ncbi:MAG: hypothetical protein PHF29_08395 [Candidatus Riflebacteria bacterium]|nr:hypothetical protein [Candidatus Riflebacteria bacterium]
MKLDILGEKYKVKETNGEQYEKFEADGFCEWWAKEIHIKDDIGEQKEDCLMNMKEYRNNTIRHEIVHAFLFESGMKKYERDEEIVEWIARNILKINEQCEKAIKGLSNNKGERC